MANAPQTEPMFKHLFLTAFVITFIGFVSVAMAQTSNPSKMVRQNVELDTKEFPCLEEYGNLKKRPKRGFVGVGSIIRDASLSRYEKIWADQVDVGFARDRARDLKHLGGNVELKITVEMLPRGQVGSIEIDRSSGFEKLDTAAVASIKDSVPFVSFPQELCMKFDILHLVSTIQFTSSGARLKRTQIE